MGAPFRHASVQGLGNEVEGREANPPTSARMAAQPTREQHRSFSWNLTRTPYYSKAVEQGADAIVATHAANAYAAPSVEVEVPSPCVDHSTGSVKAAFR